MTTRSADEWEMSRSCQRATFSRATSEHPRTTRASPQIRSAPTGFRLWGIAGEPFWPRPNGSCTSPTPRRALLAPAERLLHLADLGARQVPDLEVEGVERGRDDRERREELGVAVALEDLRRGGRGLQPDPLAREPLELRIRRGVGPDGARELADAHPLERRRDPLATARQLE